MPTTQTLTFGMRRIVPVYEPERAKRHHVNLAVGVYSAGLLLGVRTANTRQNEVQRITVTATGGSYSITWDGYTTANLLFSANAAAIAAALQALPNIGSTGVTASGAGPYDVTFTGALGYSDQALMTINNVSLTGGTVVPTEQTKGNPGGGMLAVAYADGGAGGIDPAVLVLEYDTEVKSDGRYIVGGGMWGEGFSSAPAFYCGDFYASEIIGLDAGAVADLKARYISPNILRIP